MSKDDYQPFFAVFGSHSIPKAKHDARTSLTHPLEIALVLPFERGGLIGLTFCPGKKDDHALTGRWDRCLRTDLEAIRRWGAVVVVSLIEDHEFDALAVRELPDECLRQGMEFVHLPIRDLSTPDAAFEERWATVGEGLRSRLRNGFNVDVTGWLWTGLIERISQD